VWKPGAALAAGTAIVADRHVRGFQLLGGFDGGGNEGSNEGWSLEGDLAVQAAAVATQNPIERQIGRGRLSSFGERGDAGRGSATSPTFEPQPGDALALLVAGGSGREVGVSLVSDGQPLATWRGAGSERFQQVLYDLTPHAGKRVAVRVFDDSKKAWGHIMVDQVVLMRP
jgi:hypothetical protein